MKAITPNCQYCSARLRSAVSIISPAMRFSTSSLPFNPSSLRNIPQVPLVAFAKKNNSGSEPVLSPSITDEVFMDDDLEEDILLDGIHSFFVLINSISDNPEILAKLFRYVNVKCKFSPAYMLC